MVIVPRPAVPRRQPIPALLLAVVAAGGAAFARTEPAAAVEPPQVAQLPIVDRAIEHHGGELFEKTRTRLTLCSASGCFDLDVRRDGGLYEYVVAGEVSDALRWVRITNDETERRDDGEPVALSAAEERRARDFANARVYFPFLPYGLDDPNTYKQDLGLERWGDRELHKVKATFAAGTSTDASDEYLYWFDPESGRLEQLAYSFGSGDRAGVRLRKAYNFRRVGGLLFSDQENLGAEAPGIRVDAVTPAFVAEMRRVSTVLLKDIRVEPLADSPAANE